MEDEQLLKLIKELFEKGKIRIIPELKKEYIEIQVVIDNKVICIEQSSSF